MISTVRWLPRGAAKANPDRYEMSPAELAMLKKQTEQKVENSEEFKKERMDELNAQDEMSDANEQDDNGDSEDGVQDEDDAFMKSLKLETYDEEEGPAMLSGASSELAVAGTSMEVHGEGEDQYLDLPDADDDSDDDEDVVIKPTDNVCLVGRTDDEQSTLEVYVYEDDDCTLYVHHDFPLPAFPLALEYIGSGSGQDEDQKHNFVAVGTFQPQIEIWNLDVMDVLEPSFACGGRDEPNAETVAKYKKYKKKKKKVPKRMQEAALLGDFKDDSHTDAVMCLGWHQANPQQLVSGSADHTVKTWDWSVGRCTSTINPHNNKIQSLAIHPTEPSIVLTGSYDQTVGMLDLRNQGENMVKFKVDSDVEKVVWNPNDQQNCLVSCESGALYCFDVRNPDKAVFTIQAHNKATSCLAFNRRVPNLLATASLDHEVKLWDLSDGTATCVLSKNLDIGAIFSLDFNDPQSPFLVAAGGSKGHVAVFDTLLDRGMRQKYSQFISKSTEHYDLDSELTKMSLVDNDDDEDDSESDHED